MPLLGQSQHNRGDRNLKPSGSRQSTIGNRHRRDSYSMTEALSPAQLATRLARSAWFRSAPAALQTQLIDGGRIERLAAGERLFTRGDSDDSLYCVLSGLMRIGAASVSGKEALVAVIEPVNWFGEIALFDDRPRTHDAYAERETELFHVPRAALAALLERKPAYWHTFGLLLTQKLRLASDAIEEAALLPAAQ